MRVSDRSWAYLLLRLLLGTNICVHGVIRILAGPARFAASLLPAFAHTPLSPTLVYGYAMALPWAEAAVGLLILLGLWRRPTLLTGGAMLISLTFGTTLRQDWESAGLQLIYGLTYAVLLAFLQYDRFALDRVLHRGGRGAWQAEYTGSELP